MGMNYGETVTKRKRVFVNRNFAMVWIGGTIARLCEALLLTGGGLWIFNYVIKNQPSAAASAIKGITIIGFLALFLLGPIAGVFVDRWANKKRVLQVTSALRAFCPLLPLLVALWLPSGAQSSWEVALALGSVYLATFFVSTMTHFAIPASYVLFADFVEEDDYSYANGLLLTTSFLALLLGAPLAILLFSTIGFPGLLLIDALLYLASFLASTSIQEYKKTGKQYIQPKRFFSEFKDGIVFCLKNASLVILMIALVLINIWNGAFTMIGGTFVTQSLHVAYVAAPVYALESPYGTFGLPVGIAFAAASLAFGLNARRLGEKRVFSYSLLFLGLLTLLVSGLTQFLPAMEVIFVINCLTMGVNVTAVPMYLWVTPRHMLGRIRAILDFVMNLAPIIAGAVFSGLLTSGLKGVHFPLFGATFGPVNAAFAIVGVICSVGGLLVVLRFATGKKAVVTTIETNYEQNISDDLNTLTPETIASGKF